MKFNGTRVNIKSSEVCQWSEAAPTNTKERDKSHVKGPKISCDKTLWKKYYGDVS
jgi:hypothetical protein